MTPGKAADFLRTFLLRARQQQQLSRARAKTERGQRVGTLANKTTVEAWTRFFWRQGEREGSDELQGCDG